MGLVYPGVPRELVERLHAASAARIFVETGTLLGGSAAWAAAHFDRVITIEAAVELHRRARERHASLRNIQFRLGDSRSELPAVLREIDGPAIFWLDGHWSGDSTYGQDDECPLMDELRSILSAGAEEHVILIDDARHFLAPPPPPHSVEAWPTIGEILGALGQSDRYTIILEDVIVSVPLPLRTAAQTYARAVAVREQQARIRFSGRFRPILHSLRRFVQRA